MTKGRLLVLALAAALTLLASSAVSLGSSTVADPVGLARLKAGFDATSVVRGIATLGHVPTSADIAALQALGLTVQPMKHLPLALVRGPVQSIEAAVRAHTANDVYPDDRIQLLDQTSSDAMGAAYWRAKGFTGKGVTVAVVDSGCDATHPDLADHVVHNVKLYSPEYVNNPPDSSDTIVVPVELGPYNNSDIAGGHGTHVAGIIAADGHTAPDHIGVAPDANLVCVSIGEVLFTTAVVTAYDYLLDQPNLWNVRVINNSWGNAFQQFDPRAPVAVATRAMADLGVNVVFASGNSGSGEAEAGLNPFSEAPWVTSVAAEDVQHVRGEFSSNGFVVDNSLPSTIGAGGHTTFTGDRIGVYHPDVTAPGVNISSTCDTAGTAVGPCPPGQNTEASGTSMASPHVAGAVAVLLQANSQLTPDQVRSVLESTAKPVQRDDSSANAPFWQVGYGRVDLKQATTLVRRSDWQTALQMWQRDADYRIRTSNPYKVTTSDLWTWNAPRVAVNGLTDSRTFTTSVSSTTTSLKVVLSHPSLAVVDLNEMKYTATVTDAAGKVLGKTAETSGGAGTASILIDIAAVGATPGTFTIGVTGDRAVSDPDTLDSESLLGRMVVLQVAQLQAR